jgi:hypothetical protein
MHSDTCQTFINASHRQYSQTADEMLSTQPDASENVVNKAHLLYSQTDLKILSTEHTINTARQLSDCCQHNKPFIQSGISQAVVNTAHL